MPVKADVEVVVHTADRVFIKDLNLGNMSITNDAENVVETVLRWHPGKRIIYQDSEGQWDELCHENGEFSGFRNYEGELPHGEFR